MDRKRVENPAVRQHLELDTAGKPELSVQCLPYESVYSELQAVCATLGPKDKVWISDKASCALTQAIPKVSLSLNTHTHTCCTIERESMSLEKKKNLSLQIHRSPIPYTPLCLAKAVKNPTEIQGMKKAHVRTNSSTTISDKESPVV